LDALLRALRSALLVSHDVRRDVCVYLVLRGGPRAPRLLRIDGSRAKFLRPDERSLAILIKKSLDAALPHVRELSEVRPGIDLCEGDLPDLLASLGDEPRYILEEGAADLRGQSLAQDAWFFLGDHQGFDAASRAQLAARGALPLSVGPRSLHAEDVVAVVNNELDRTFNAAAR